MRCRKVLRFLFFLVLVVPCLVVRNSHAQAKWDWVRKDGSGGFTVGQAISTDRYGNCYIAGSFCDTVRFGAITLFDTNCTSLFVAKYDPNGDVLWVKALHGEASFKEGLGSNAVGIAVDQAGNCFVTANFTSHGLYFDTSFLFQHGSNPDGASDILLLKLTSGGAFVWAKKIGGQDGHGGADAGGICIDREGNFFIAGGCDTAWFGEKSVLDGIFISKFDNDGNCLWVNVSLEDELPYGRALGVCIDSNNSSFITGVHTYPFQFDSVRVNSSTPGGLFGYSAFIVKFDTNGKAVWGKDAGGQGLTRGYGVAADRNGNCYFTGSCTEEDTTYIDTSWFLGDEIFLVRIDSSGNVSWAKSCGGGGGAYGICCDPESNVTIAGSVTNSSIIVFDTIRITGGAPGADLFVAQYNADGHAVWAKKAGGWQYDEGIAVTTVSNGDCLVTGMITFAGIAPENGAPVFDTIMPEGDNIGDYFQNMFVGKLSSKGKSEVFTIRGQNKKDVVLNDIGNHAAIILSNRESIHAANIEIFDVLGHDVSQDFLREDAGGGITLISNHRSGVYYYRIVDVRVTSPPFSIIGTGKFVVQ